MAHDPNRPWFDPSRSTRSDYPPPEPRPERSVQQKIFARINALKARAATLENPVRFITELNLQGQATLATSRFFDLDVINRTLDTLEQEYFPEVVEPEA